MPKTGVIGGSGLYSMPGFTEHNEVAMDTPFGKPSDNYIVGQLEGKEVAQERLVPATPGQMTVVDFTQPQSEALPPPALIK